MTDSLQIEIEPRLHAVAPALALGVVRGSITASAHDPALWSRLTELIEERARQPPLDDVRIAAVREAYRALGKDPSRYRGSAESLLRRLKKSGTIPSISTVVDVNNFISLESLHPVGCYNAGAISGPIRFLPGGAGEHYTGIGKREINLENLPVLADAAGPFGSPTSDSLRAMTTASTTQLLLVVYGFAGEGMPAIVARAVDLLTAYAGARGLDTSVSALPSDETRPDGK